PPPGSPDDGEDLRWDGIDATPGQIQTRPLDARDCEVLVSMRSGASGIIGSVGAMAAIIGIVLAVTGIYSLDIRAIAAIVFGVVCVLAVPAFLMSKEDARLRSDLDTGIKLIISGRIDRMGSEEGDGPGFVTVLIDETPSRKLEFFVEKRLYQLVKPEDIVRIAYVPLSKTVLQLRAGHCSYSRRPDPSKGGANMAA
ncbi:hypothetical protein AB4084_13105, partial [Lysobacter sp. 2RAB21]